MQSTNVKYSFEGNVIVKAVWTGPDKVCVATITKDHSGYMFSHSSLTNPIPIDKPELLSLDECTDLAYETLGVWNPKTCKWAMPKYKFTINPHEGMTMLRWNRESLSYV